MCRSVEAGIPTGAYWVLLCPYHLGEAKDSEECSLDPVENLCNSAGAEVPTGSYWVLLSLYHVGVFVILEELRDS